MDITRVTGTARILLFVFSACWFMLFLAVAACNWLCICLNLRNKRRGIYKHYSLVYAVGLMSFYCSFVFLPMRYSPYLWLVIVLDPGVPMLLIGLPIAFLVRSIGSCFRHVYRRR